MVTEASQTHANRRRPAALLLLVAAMAGAPVMALAQKARGPLQIPGGKSHEPVNIVADKLEYFDKEQKAVYSGNVAVTQGEAVMKCATLTIFMTKSDKAPDPAGKEAVALAGNSDVSRMEAAGPVTIVQKDQTGTGDSGLYERAENRVTLSGHAKLQQGPNTTTGERIVYSIVEGRAVVEGNVKSFLVPGSSPNVPGGDSDTPKKKPKP
jgi:lipopolysaccharide export system protein LptA